MGTEQADNPFVASLTNLGRLLVDLGRLYDRAADIADDLEAKQAIRQAREDRLALLERVQAELARKGAGQEEHGSVAGLLQAAVLNVRAVVDEDDHAALAEVHRGEGFLLSEVQEALRAEGLTPEQREFLKEVAAAAHATHATISALGRR